MWKYYFFFFALSLFSGRRGWRGGEGGSGSYPSSPPPSSILPTVRVEVGPPQLRVSGSSVTGGSVSPPRDLDYRAVPNTPKPTLLTSTQKGRGVCVCVCMIKVKSKLMPPAQT